MRLGFNIAMICIVALLCITAVAITGLAMGHNSTIVALSFTALGAIPAGIIAWLTARKQNRKDEKLKGGK